MSWHGHHVCFLPCLLLELGVLLGEAAMLVKTIHNTPKEADRESCRELGVGEDVIK